VKLRSFLFAVWFYVWMVIFGTLGMFTFLISREAVTSGLGIWSRGVLLGLRLIAGVKIEVRGAEHLPKGQAALIAAKHQAMVDTLAPFTFVDGVCFVLKEELTKLPLFGWYCVAAGMIALNRGGQASALKALVRDTKVRIAEGRQVLIYPEGTRGPLGTAPDYKPGIAALYSALDMPCIPMATNSGAHWSHRGMSITPGTIIFEFLPPIPPGLKRAEFMARLEEAVETGSNRLVAEGI
jgi:1-acyl-sn-glycerol-3-phosphate acyltransferase